MHYPQRRTQQEGLVAADTLPRLFPSRVSFVPSTSSSSSSSSSFFPSAHHFRPHHNHHHHHHHHQHHHHSFQSRHSSPFHSYASYQHSSSKYYPPSPSKSNPSSSSSSSSSSQQSSSYQPKYQPSYVNQLPSSPSSSSSSSSSSKSNPSIYQTDSNYPQSSYANHLPQPSSYDSAPSSSSYYYPSYHTPQPAPLTMKTSRFVVVSEGMYDHAHHIHAHERMKEEAEQVRRPQFAGGLNATSTRVFLGNTVTLDCTVHDATNETASWMRSKDDVLELITWDSNTYAKDDRYSLVTERGDRWHRWQLVIRRTRPDDQGQYRCQVSTQPPLVLVVTLNVTVPVARVVDERGTKVQEKHYNSGSMIELKCIVEQVPFPHGPVTWRRGATVLTYNTSRGGISVKGNEAGGFIRSRLYVADATPHDSGFYSCWYKNITSDTVTVHVIAGENSAAMQHDGLPGSGGNVSGGPACLHPSLALSSFLFLVTMATWVLASSSSSCSTASTSSSTCSSSSSFPPSFLIETNTLISDVWEVQTIPLCHQKTEDGNSSR